MQNRGPQDLTREQIESMRSMAIHGKEQEMEHSRRGMLAGVELLETFLKDNAPHIGGIMLVAIAHPGEMLVDRTVGKTAKGVTLSFHTDDPMAGYLSMKTRQAAEGIEPLDHPLGGLFDTILRAVDR